MERFGADRVEDSLYFHDPDGALLEITRDPLSRRWRGCSLGAGFGEDVEVVEPN